MHRESVVLLTVLPHRARIGRIQILSTIGVRKEKRDKREPDDMSRFVKIIKLETKKEWFCKLCTEEK